MGGRGWEQRLLVLDDGWMDGWMDGRARIRARRAEGGLRSYGCMHPERPYPNRRDKTLSLHQP
eukprot:scaffold1059_cov298-Prasinococcus_capsulatus_cf.AAC.2